MPDEQARSQDKSLSRRQEVTLNGVKMVKEVKFEKIHNQIGSIDEVKTTERSIGNSVLAEITTTRDGVVISDVFDTQLNAFEIHELDLVWQRYWPTELDFTQDDLSRLHRNLLDFIYMNEETKGK